MTIIGLAGWAGVGKDSIGDILVEEYGFTKVAFADPLREMAAAINPIVGFLHSKPFRYNDALEQYGYTQAKLRFPEIRSFLQLLGTEAARNVLGTDIWVDTAMGRLIEGTDYVFCDVRFPNELRAVKDVGGVAVRVHRPEVRKVNAHVSETALDNYVLDDFIENNGTVDDLRDEVARLMKGIR